MEMAGRQQRQSDPLVLDYESLYRSYTALLREVEYLSTLREISLAINTSLDLHDTLKHVASVLEGALEARRIVIYEYDEETGDIKPLIARFNGETIGHSRLAEEHIEPRNSIVPQAIRERRVIVESTDYPAEVCIPLAANNRILGALHAEEPEEGKTFTHADENLYRSLGAQVAVSINNARLYAMAVTDSLTGLYVRRYFDLRLEEEFSAAERYRRMFSVLLIDIDHFKAFNDTHGHQTGDAVLCQFAQLISGNTRKSDICCRYGGEEVAVILPETRLHEAAVLANKLCARIREHSFKGDEGQELHVTASFGVAAYSPSFEKPSKMITAADRALYRAKASGRDRVALAEL